MHWDLASFAFGVVGGIVLAFGVAGGLLLLFGMGMSDD